MNLRTACVFVLAASSAALSFSAAAQHPLDTLPVGEWYEVPNSAVRGVAYQYPPGTYFGNTTDMRFLDESGASYDSARDRMIVWGGGHGDYAGNEIYTFNIQSLTWTRINDPSPRFDDTAAIETTGYYPDASGNPDPQQPRSRHSYWYALYVPNLDRYCSMGMVFAFPSSKTTTNVDCFDFVSRRWERKSNAMTTGGLAQAV